MKYSSIFSRTALTCMACFLLFGVFGVGDYSGHLHAFETDMPAGSIDGLFDRLNRSIAGGDVAGAMSCFDPDRESLIRDMQTAVTNAVNRGDTCVLRFEPVATYAADDQTEVCVHRIFRYTENDRSHGADAWRTMILVQGSNGWVIRDMEPRVYAQPEYTTLDVVLDPDNGTLHGKAELRLAILEPGETMFLIALNRGLALDAVTDADGRDLTYSRVGDQIRIPWPGDGMQEGTTGTLRMKYHGSLFNESKEHGYTQVNIGPEGSFASWVTNWYPNLESGISKSPGRIEFRVPDDLDVVCNGIKHREDVMGGMARYVFDVGAPLDYTFAAARYTSRDTMVDNVQIGAYFLTDDAAKAELYLKKSADLIGFLKEVYDGYPFDSYYIVEIPSAVTGTLGGSSEQGMNLFPDKMLPDTYFNLPLFAHEIGHSWWGNLINGTGTAFVNEGLAQFSAVLAVEHFHGAEAMRRFLRYGYPNYSQSELLYFALIAGDSTFDIPLGLPKNGMESILHLLSDLKGHYALNTIRERLGHDTFIRGLRRAIETHAGRSMSLNDLRRVMEQTAGQPLDIIFNQWFYRSGAPELTLRWTSVEDGAGYRVDGCIEQADAYDLMVDVVFHGSAGQTHMETVHTMSDDQTFSLRLPFEPVDGVLDPDHKILRWTPYHRQLSEIQPLLLKKILLSMEVEDFEQQYIDYLKKHPDDVFAWIGMGQMYTADGKTEAAISAFQEALNLCRQDRSNERCMIAMASLKLGELYEQTHQPALARDCYKNILAQSNLTEYQEIARGAVRRLDNPPVTTNPPQ